ncbi:4Fe-4S dicluster domain-containing protein [Bacteroidetes/Chlorobi group bacterium Naka2016]|jgi:Fe-S oxidoreductase|nr:MAG: 4Fe-4S dicluster domain-containing protein [Bacteroidetes/Chlorobi group bacterium Naka2016]
MVKVIIFAIFTVIAFGFLIFNLYRFSRILKLARKETRTDRFALRLKNALKIALFQSKILREPFAGILHVSIFWGFLALLFSASEAVFQGFYSEFSWSILGPFYTVISLSNDLFCVFVVFAVIFALVRRFIFRVKRLQGDKREMLDAFIVLGSIFIIVSALLLENSAKIALNDVEEYSLQPFATLLSGIFAQDSANVFYNIFWWVHILWIYFFMNYLYYSKHFHVYTSIQNVFFREPEYFFKPTRIDFEAENLEKFGAQDFEDLSWKSIHDGFSCTHCGRCDSVCPANTTGKVLSPRQIIIQIRKRAQEKGSVVLKLEKNSSDQNIKEEYRSVLDKKFIGDYQSWDALWQCTTCGACMMECPISIEHLHPIIEMRRSLVLMESNFPSLLQNVFTSLENNFAPWQFPSADRAEWAKDLNVPLASESPDFEYLFWVGCAGSFDERAKKIARAFAQILQKADINFAILGPEEICNGDVARRSGNEYLADYLIKTNVETLNRYNVKKMLTICPHCYNIFKNEYPDFGFKAEIIHHTQFIETLISSGKIKLKRNSNQRVTYHDSCYLGRYNGIYETPRNIIKNVYDGNFVEVKRSKDKGLCCGAGGGMMFLEETAGKRVNIERTEELLKVSPNVITSNCPFCMTMLVDGVKAKNLEENVQVKDLAEIVWENME